MPPLKNTPLRFLHDVKNQKKLLFKRKDITNLEVPSLPEISLEKMWPIANKDPQFRMYVPDTWYKDTLKKADREYFWVVFSTLNENFVSDLVDDVRR